MFKYTDEDKQADDKLKHPYDHAGFSRMRAVAMDYFLQVSMPNLNNWAKLEFVWF